MTEHEGLQQGRKVEHSSTDKNSMKLWLKHFISTGHYEKKTNIGILDMEVREEFHTKRRGIVSKNAPRVGKERRCLTMRLEKCVSC